MCFTKKYTIFFSSIILFSCFLTSCDGISSSRSKDISGYSSHLTAGEKLEYEINLSSLNFMTSKNEEFTNADFGVLDSDVSKSVYGKILLKDVHMMYMIASTYHWCNMINRYSDDHEIKWTYWKNGGRNKVGTFEITNSDAKRVMQNFGRGQVVSLIFTNSGMPAADAKISLPNVTDYTANRFVKEATKIRSR